jgi:LETM1 and EF-hand domain-containing protein 1, mitochondrial
LNEAELEVDSEKASYKQKLEVLQQQQELIEDEEEQEQKEEDARRAKREADEQEARTAESLLPDSEVSGLTRIYVTTLTLHGSYYQKRWKRRMLA